jgi:D-alanyl-D-alanine carboxypeptidase/D-alanyl-D-alanine-endopeptidase (penicillin-binding protein 4)
VDGSGLSRQDLVSPANLVAVLENLRNSEQFHWFFNSLPVAGVDGPLRHRMKNSLAAGNCHAKTGYLTGVCTIAGYVTGKDGTPFVFAIMMNNHVCSEADCQKAQDTIIEILANHSKQRRTQA